MQIKYDKTIHNKSYFWYLLRSIQYLQSVEEIELVPIESELPEHAKYEAIFYINGLKVYIDLRDDLKLPYNKYEDCDCMVKSNYITSLNELLPKGIEYQFTDKEEAYLHLKVLPFANGRSFNYPLNFNEFDKCPNKDKKYIIKSFSGAGLYDLQTESRLRFYNLIKGSFEESDIDLRFWYPTHYKGNISSEYQDLPKLRNSLETYYNWISDAKYILNFPGIACSQPFRFIDATICNCAVISSKIWHPAWRSFPCVELPVCGYTGEGDWKTAKDILNHLLPENIEDTLQKQKVWYNKYLSKENMFKEQILKQLETL